jgi:trans-2,3-dihydro-3-hydroxyanthranilate isomerase
MKLEFATVDVFTDRRFGGNPLAVVTNAQGLSTEQMQAIAAEFNLAETTFVLPPKDAAHTAEVRIFTPKAEMPFAGHPNVGTAFVLARAGESYGRAISSDRLVFEEKAGLVPLDITREQGTVVAARLAAPQMLTLGDEIPADVVAAICGLQADQIETRTHRPIIASCGNNFVFAEVKSRAALAQAAVRSDLLAKHVPMARAVGVHLYVPIGLLAHLRPEADLDLSKTIGQGFDMGRPSILEASAEKAGGKVTATYIGGRCVPMFRGTIDLT